MPTYRYECGRCEVVQEIFHSMSETLKRKCPECGGKLTRLIGTGGGVLLKGSGFYTTDYRSDSYKSAAKKDSESPKPKGDSKPADKSGSTPAKPKSKPKE